MKKFAGLLVFMLTITAFSLSVIAAGLMAHAAKPVLVQTKPHNLQPNKPLAHKNTQKV